GAPGLSAACGAGAAAAGFAPGVAPGAAASGFSAAGVAAMTDGPALRAPGASTLADAAFGAARVIPSGGGGGGGAAAGRLAAGAFGRGLAGERLGAGFFSGGWRVSGMVGTAITEACSGLLGSGFSASAGGCASATRAMPRARRRAIPLRLG